MPVSEGIALALENLAAEVAEAIARGEFERARELIEAAIRLRADGLAPSNPSEASESEGTGPLNP